MKRLLDIRHAQLAAAQTKDQLAKAVEAGEAERATLIRKARNTAERGIEIYDGNDNLWWLLARARLLDGDLPGASAAGQAALLLRPSWTRLPVSTRVGLELETTRTSPVPRGPRWCPRRSPCQR